MERITRNEFNELDSFDVLSNRIKYLDSKYLLKYSKRNSLEYLEFLVSLNEYNLPNLLFPKEIFEILENDDSINYAIKIKRLKRHNSLIDEKYKKYSTSDILKIYKGIMLSLKSIHELGLIQLDVANRNILIKNKNHFLFDWDTSLIFKDNILLTYNPNITDYVLNYSNKRVLLDEDNYFLKSDFVNEDKAVLLYTLFRVLDNCSFRYIGIDDSISGKYLLKTINSLNLPKEIYEKIYSYFILKEEIDNNYYFEDVFDFLIENDYKRKIKKP